MAVRGVFAGAERAFGLLTEGRSAWWPLPAVPTELESVPHNALRWQLGEGEVLVELTATTPVTTRVRIEQTGGEPVDWDAVLAAFASVAGDPTVHEVFGRLLNNETWVRLDAASSEEDTEAAIRAAQAQAYHWYLAGGPEEQQRAEWLLAHAYTAAGVAERSTHHANRCWQLTERYDLQDFDRAYALLALSRAAALNGDPAGAESLRTKAFAVPIANPADAKAFHTDATP